MFYKVADVKPLPEFMLTVRFCDGTTRKYDVKPLFDKWENFRAFMSVTGLFEQVRVDAGGYGISWNDFLDLSCNELYENGQEI
jgi:hypothetical protein